MLGTVAEGGVKDRNEYLLCPGRSNENHCAWKIRLSGDWGLEGASKDVWVSSWAVVLPMIF